MHSYLEGLNGRTVMGFFGCQSATVGLVQQFEHYSQSIGLSLIWKIIYCSAVTDLH